MGLVIANFQLPIANLAEIGNRQWEIGNLLSVAGEPD